MEMNCGEVEARLLELLDGTLDDADKALVTQHLGTCPRCQATHNQMSAADHFLRSELPPAAESISAPEFLALRIKHKLSHGSGTWWQNRGTQRMWAAAAAIAIIVLAGIGLKMLPRGTQQHNQAPSTAIAKKSDQPAVFIVIMPRAIPDIPRIDHASAASQSNPTPDNIFAQPPLHRPRDAAHPAPTIQSPVRVMVKNVQFNPDM